MLAERRGDHVALLFRTDNPDVSAPCLVRNVAGSGEVADVDVAAGGSSGPAQGAPPRGFTEGAISQFAGADGASITDGAVGAKVRAVTIHAAGLTVHATVRNGRYAAWWPGRAFAEAPAMPNGEGGPVPILTYDLVLGDGTVVHDARPARPL